MEAEDGVDDRYHATTSEQAQNALYRFFLCAQFNRLFFQISSQLVANMLVSNVIFINGLLIVRYCLTFIVI